MAIPLFMEQVFIIIPGMVDIIIITTIVMVFLFDIIHTAGGALVSVMAHLMVGMGIPIGDHTIIGDLHIIDHLIIDQVIDLFQADPFMPVIEMV
jgi:hypothetical protein